MLRRREWGREWWREEEVEDRGSNEGWMERGENEGSREKCEGRVEEGDKEESLLGKQQSKTGKSDSWVWWCDERKKCKESKKGGEKKRYKAGKQTSEMWYKTLGMWEGSEECLVLPVSLSTHSIHSSIHPPSSRPKAPPTTSYLINCLEPQTMLDGRGGRDGERDRHRGK